MGTRPIDTQRSARETHHPHAYGDKTRLQFVSLQSLGSSPRVWGQAASPVRSVFVIRIIPTRMGTSLLINIWKLSRAYHPHAYGDKSARVLTCLRQQGSSPRVWGQGDDSAVDRTSPGIIPTRMGTSLPSVVVPVFRKDHPHAYGDKKLSRLMAVWILGSSPRVWGQAMYGYTVNALKGIIPTRMGTSHCRLTLQSVSGDHPHAYGDKFK